ncbi:flavin reductase family protein [Paludibacterium yongneupense]|uniref:flavin reductase family protein n=1 Tax=Paludibacterium yongneupense TaxID=400061 RepID=UPI000686B932|nr:iron-sulfur cluster-binding domain-containing protein [Paludibacterium yongneupense]
MTPLISSPATVWQGLAALRCLARCEQTPDSASFDFALPTGLRAEFRPGQFISLGPVIEGKAQFRAYSIASSPGQAQTLTLGIKRVEDGLVSNWLFDTLQAGMSVDALAPAGEFCLDMAALPDALLLLSAGSGITPMLSMARAVLESGCDAAVHFVHSARSEDDLMFAAELQALAAQYPTFRLELFLSRPTGRLSCHAGRLDADRLGALLPRAARVQVYMCGQEGYMDMAMAALLTAGLQAAAIHRESFAASSSVVAADARRYRLSVPAFGRQATIAAGESLLDALEREGLPIIGACRTGVCGSCKCRVVDGEVESSSQLPLTAQEIGAGYVLACSSHASGDLTLVL